MCLQINKGQKTIRKPVTHELFRINKKKTQKHFFSNLSTSSTIQVESECTYKINCFAS